MRLLLIVAIVLLSVFVIGCTLDAETVELETVNEPVIMVESNESVEENLTVELDYNVVARKVGNTISSVPGKLSGSQELWVIVNFGDDAKVKLTTNCYLNETLIEDFDTETHTLKNEQIFEWYALCHNESITKRNISIEYLEE
ncbi:hypothetical protein HN587_01615 [Candidatus Woesearchaeota archaeon]|jgi:hypothetical protein|nr:hypothetical protein [Candidatus Woesearchaeota archaeon]